MNLHLLNDLIGDLGVEPSEEHINQLYHEFRRDFIENPFILNGLRVKVILTNSNIADYEHYPETFVHLITRKSSSKHRVFDRHRANKIHWIRCILEHADEDDILCFKFREGDGKIRDYFWYEAEDFLVIMEEVTPDILIITSFYIDDDKNRNYYRKRYEDYENKWE